MYEDDEFPPGVSGGYMGVPGGPECGASSPEPCRDNGGFDECVVLLLAPDGCRWGRSCLSNDGRLSMEGLASRDGLASNEGLVSNEGLLPELLIGLEKFEKLGAGRCSCCDPLMEYSEVIDGDLCIGCIHGENGDCGLDTPLLPENLRDEDKACEPLVDWPSSSPLSGGTERILWKLRGDFGYRGDCGGARPRSEVTDR